LNCRKVERGAPAVTRGTPVPPSLRVCACQPARFSGAAEGRAEGSHTSAQHRIAAPSLDARHPATTPQFPNGFLPLPAKWVLPGQVVDDHTMNRSPMHPVPFGMFDHSSCAVHRRAPMPLQPTSASSHVAAMWLLEKHTPSTLYELPHTPVIFSDFVRGKLSSEHVLALGEGTPPPQTQQPVPASTPSTA
jgi:hypothetical protein